MQYTVTRADRRPLPAPWYEAERYLGYQDSDFAKPWAHFMQDRSLPVQPHVHDAIATGPVAAEFGLRVRDMADHMNKPGYRHLETGYTTNEDGHVVVAVLTDMPGVTGEMWDWWFGWHSTDTTRYKLWNPDAHQFAALGEDRSADRSLTDRQRYQHNVSYVNEYIGDTSSPLAIRFLNPEQTAFGSSKPGETTILIRGGSPLAPVAVTWLIHQIRKTDTGTEMRSRFIVNDITMLDLPAHSVDGRGRILTNPAVSAVGGRVLPKALKQKASVFAPPMLQHCAQEMNHLATFLPEIYSEFHDQP